MARPIIYLTVLALAGAGLPGAAGAVAGKTFAAQVGDAYAFEAIDFVLAGALGGLGISTGAGLYPATVVVAAYPFAAAFGADVGARAVGDPAPNRGEAIFGAAVAAYAETALLYGAALAYETTHRDVSDVHLKDVYAGLLLFDIISKPFLVTFFYNHGREPAAPAEESRLAVEPYISLGAGGDGRSVPVYGVAVSF